MNFRTSFPLNQLHIEFTIPTWLIASLVMMTAIVVGCTDDFEPKLSSSNDQIRFAVSVSNEWNNSNLIRSTAYINENPKDTAFSTISSSDVAYYLHTRTTINNNNPFDADDIPATRGNMLSLKDYDSFGLLAGIYENEWDESICSANYIYNVKCNHINGNSFALSEPYFWPGMGQKIRFWGYAPYNHPNISISDINSIGSPFITYTVPHNYDEQVDIITVMAEGAKDGDGAQILTFNHALTAIQFVLADDVKEGAIKSISINGVYSKATNVLGEKMWKVSDITDNFYIEFNPDFTTGIPNNSKDIVVDEKTFLMIPQILPDGAEIIVEFIDVTNTTRELRASIAGSEWKAGYVVTYHISTNSILYTPIIELNEDSYTFPFHAGLQTREFPIKSFLEISQVGEPTTYRQEPFSYELLDENGKLLQFSDDNPPFITVSPLMPIPVDSEPLADKPASSGSLSVAALTKYGNYVEEENEYDRQLKNAPFVSFKNLAGESGSETTANCYIVEASGRYTFPLVYGNALVDGKENTTSYTNQQPTSNKFVDYPNYKGSPIQKASILEDIDVKAVGLGTADLLWQDQKGLIKNVLLKDGYIEFEVLSESIREGNALIALSDKNGDIIWSWHIWITRLDDDIEVSNGAYMSSYIGYCHPHKRYYSERNVTLRITQDRSGHFKDLSIKLSEGIIPDVGNSVLYQWGRKDPLPGLILDLTDTGSITEPMSFNKPVYSIDGHSLNLPTVINNRISINESILHPTAQATSSSNSVIWHELLKGNDNSWYLNLWDAKETKTNHKTIDKTIYDPSPSGYSILSPLMVYNFRASSFKPNNKTTPNLCYTLTPSGNIQMNFPFTLRRNHTGGFEDAIEMSAFYIWGSPATAYSMLLPSEFGGSKAIVQSRIFGNVALPVLSMRQN